MPKVKDPRTGKERHFGSKNKDGKYDDKDVEEAKAFAKKTGQKVRYQVGGLVTKSGGKPQRVKTRGTGAATRGTHHYTVGGSNK